MYLFLAGSFEMLNSPCGSLYNVELEFYHALVLNDVYVVIRCCSECVVVVNYSILDAAIIIVSLLPPYPPWQSVTCSLFNIVFPSRTSQHKK